MANEKHAAGITKKIELDGLGDFKPVSVEGDNTDVPYPGEYHQRLFEHMYEQHGLILLCTELDDIVRIVEEEY